MSAARPPAQWIALASLALAVAVVWTVASQARHWEPCADPGRLVDMTGIPMTRTWEIRTEEHAHTPLLAWAQGEIERPSGDLDYQVMRSDQGMNHRLSWHLKLQRLYEPESTWTETLDAGGETVPVHWSRQRIEYGNLYLTARMDFLGTRPIRLLLWDLLETAPGQLLFGTLAITSYVVEIAVEPEHEARSRGLARQWLAAVADRNREACTP